MDRELGDASQCGTPQQHVPAEVQCHADTQIATALFLASAEAQGGVAAECAHVQRALAASLVGDSRSFASSSSSLSHDDPDFLAVHAVQPNVLCFNDFVLKHLTSNEE